MYDLIVRRGRVLDPSQGIDETTDVAVRDGRIARIDRDISSPGTPEVDARGRIVTPGLIDLHCHVVETAGAFTVAPDVAGTDQGVTTVVDGGSAGRAAFPAFAKYIAPGARTRVYAFLSLSSTGQSLMPELASWAEVDEAALVEVVAAHRDVVRGIKVRLVGALMASHGVQVARRAKEIARRVGLPLMVHLGDSRGEVPTGLTREVLPLLEHGDVLSHVYTARPGGVVTADGAILPELADAASRGVILDVAHGMSNCSFSVAREAIAKGFLPTTISSDLSAASVASITFGLTATMTKFVTLGLGLAQVVEMTTVNPARALGASQTIGTLREGADADISIIELASLRCRLYDAEGQWIEADSVIAPVMAIRAGRPVPVGSGTWLRYLDQSGRDPNA